MRTYNTEHAHSIGSTIAGKRRAWEIPQQLQVLCLILHERRWSHGRRSETHKYVCLLMSFELCIHLGRQGSLTSGASLEIGSLI